MSRTLEAGCMELIGILSIGGGGFNLHLRARSFTIKLGWIVFFRIFSSGEIGFGVLSLSCLYHKRLLMEGRG